MGIAYIKKTSPNSLVGLWHITETVEELLIQLNLSQYDVEILEGKKNVNRKREWLATRKLFQAMTNRAFEIRYQPDGKPFIKNGDDQISISHSHDYACVYLHSETPVGIDIQKVKPNITPGSDFFLNDNESSWIDKEDNMMLHIIWSAKESMFKFCGISELDIKKDLTVMPFIRNQIGIIEVTIGNRGIKKNIFVEYEIFENYILTRTL